MAVGTKNGEDPPGAPFNQRPCFAFDCAETSDARRNEDARSRSLRHLQLGVGHREVLFAGHGELNKAPSMSFLSTNSAGRASPRPQRCVASNRVIGPMPLLSGAQRAQFASVPYAAAADTRPQPVTTTRLLMEEPDGL